MKPAAEKCFRIVTTLYFVKVLLKSDEFFSYIYYRASSGASAVTV
jgi:hypothetical protein